MIFSDAIATFSGCSDFPSVFDASKCAVRGLSRIPFGVYPVDGHNVAIVMLRPSCFARRAVPAKSRPFGRIRHGAFTKWLPSCCARNVAAFMLYPRCRFRHVGFDPLFAS